MQLKIYEILNACAVMYLGNTEDAVMTEDLD